MAVQIHLMIIQIHLMIVQIILMSVQIHLMIVQIHLMIAQINRALTLTSKCPVCSPSINLTTRFSKQVQRPDTYGHRENPAQVEVPDKQDSLPTGHTASRTFSRGSALFQTQQDGQFHYRFQLLGLLYRDPINKPVRV